MRNAASVSLSSVLLVLALVLALAPAGGTAYAQPATDEASAKVRTEAEQLVTEIGEARRSLEELDRAIAAAPGEERDALDRRRTDRRREALAGIHALAERVVVLEEKGDDTSDLRPAVESLLGEASAAIRRIFASVEKELNDLSARRAEATPEEQRELDDSIARSRDRLDDLYEAMAANLTRRESLGLDASDDREYLRRKLPKRAEQLIGRLEILGEERDALQARQKVEPDNAEIPAQLAASEQRLDRVVGHLRTTLALMDRLELDTAEYRQTLIRATGTLTSDIFDSDVAVGVVGQWWREVRGNWARHLGQLLFKAVVFLAVIAVFRVLAYVARRVVGRSLGAAKVSISRLLGDMILSMTGRVVMLIGILVALSQVGVSVGPMLAGLGIAGFIVGFALQDTLSNFASGLMILFYRPFDVDDLVAAGGVEGKVKAMNLVSTTITTLDNQTLVVPNSKIWGDVIKNVTAQKERRVDMVFGISYADDIEKAEQVLRSILADHAKVLEDPAPMVRLHTLGESSVDFVVRPWVATQDYWDVYWDVTREVKVRFDREGISIPFPQRDVHLFQK